jgi:acetoin utilization protein AcuB
MRRHQFRRLPVVDEDGKLVGIVGERDLLYAPPSQPGSLNVWEVNYLLSHVEVRHVMTRDVITTTADTPVEDVARLMIDNKVGGLPVVDKQGSVGGVITETDIFKTFVEMFAGGRSGLRLTLEVPAGREILLELGKAVSESGGHIVSVGSFYGDAPGEREIVVKIRDARKRQLLETLEALGDHVVDAREV